MHQSTPRSVTSAIALLLLLFSLMRSTTEAYSLIFYSEGDTNCHFNTDHIGCYEHPAGTCCHSHAPFCDRLMLGLNTSYPSQKFTHYFMHQSQCRLSAGASYCTQGGPDESAQCCIPLPTARADIDNTTCSGFWLNGVTGASPPGWKAEAEKEAGDCMDPNYLSYNDGLEVRKIYLPHGTLQQALDAYKDKNFSALAMFKTLTEVYGNDTGMVSGTNLA